MMAWLPRNDPPSTATGTARFARLAIITLGIYLLLLHLTALYIVRIGFETVDSNSAEYLQRLARRFCEPARDYFWVLPYTWDPEDFSVDEQSLATYRELADWRNLVDSLASTGVEPRIARADLLTPGGEILLTRDGTTPSADSRGRFVEEDGIAIAAAARGQLSVSSLTPRNPVKRVYAPVATREGEIVAILRLEGEAPAGLVTLRNRLLTGVLFSFGVLAFLWWGTMQLVRRTIEAERAAAQSDRLRALGTMTAGIAHEIRNPLGIIQLQIEELKAAIQTLDAGTVRQSMASTLSDLHQEVKRLKGLTQSFLDFTKASEPQGAPGERINLSSETNETVSLWRKGLDPSRRDVRVELPAGPIMVAFPKDRLRQILLNLLRNADEALAGEKGTIQISLERAAGRVMLVVGDSGPGIPPGAHEQIFDPFFTTRAEGTGLGLSLSRALAQAAGGTLVAANRPGGGAVFTLTLPEASQEDRG
jgi:signal transduction histidine kinase